MIKTIVVATDASRHGKKAVKLASELARSLKAHLVIVHALLFDARRSSLRKIVNRQGLTRDQRKLLDNYEIDAQLTVAARDGCVHGLRSGTYRASGTYRPTDIGRSRADGSRYGR